MLCGQVEDRLHLGRLAEEMDRQNSLGAGSNGRPEQIGSCVERCWVNVDQNGRGAQQCHHIGRRRKGKIGHEYVIAWTDVERGQRHVQGGCPGADCDGVLDADKVRDPVFEVLDMLALDEVTRS
jgi:hypothetical protein